MAALKLIFFAALCTSAFATVINIRPCEEVTQDVCTVSEARITPCTNVKRCTVKKNNNVAISFDFTPNFSISKAKTMVYALIGNDYKLFAGFGSDDACTYTSCPFEAGNTQTLNYNMYLNPKTPKGSYDLQWKVWNEENDKEICCFKFPLRIR
ncbi:unnamed protein product [Arctia plantaginis]|uniref:MD-2-related lipid-recognition domain-containing protein n=1 Tax=Arctia plantaginis TaxID=874455 RepID=A0A8S1A4P2_ARCPL|nr:unnamed protein product [Arctia plantaginis]